MANPTNFRLGRRGAPKGGGRAITVKGRVFQWKPGGPGTPPNPNYFPDDYTSDTDYVEGEIYEASE